MEFRYEGVKKGYPRLRKRFGKLVGYIQLLRPFTLVAPLLAGFFGVLAPVRDLTLTHLSTAVYVGLTLALAQGCGQCVNQYADASLNGEVKPYRPIPSGMVTRDEALGLAWLLAIFSVGRAFTISTFFGLVVLTCLFFAVFYSLAPFSPRKIHPLLNTGWMALSRGFIPIFAVWSVYGNLDRAWPYSVLAFLWCLSLQGCKDINDAEADKKFGIQTIPNTYGTRGFLIYAVIITVVMYIYSCLYIPLMLTLIPVSAVALLGLNRQVGGMENNLGWICFYAGLGALYVLMFVGERLTL